MLWLFQFFNGFLPLPQSGVVMLWALIAGLASMFIYRRWSNQGKLNELMDQLRASQQELKDFDGNEFNEMMPLLKRNLNLSMRRVGMSLVPSMLAALPLILVMILVDADIRSASAAEAAFSNAAAQLEMAGNDNFSSLLNPPEPVEQQVEPEDDYLGFGPAWMRSWIFVFICVSTASALAYRQFAGIV